MGETSGGVWLTYEEAGAVLGISSEAARQRARRFHWPHRQRSNTDRRTVVSIPLDAYPDRPEQPPELEHVQPVGQPRSAGRTDPDMMNGEALALRELIAVLRDQLGKAEARTEAAAAERAGLLDIILSREEQSAALIVRVEAAERRAGEAEALLSGELARLRAEVATLMASRGEQKRTSDSRLAPESQRTTRPRRRGLLARLFG